MIDPLGGLDDLRAGRVRFIGAAQARIAEDCLRILRFFRFTAWFSRSGVDAGGASACAAGRAGLSGLSRERVGHEMRRLLAAPDPSAAVAAMAETGVLGDVLPGARPDALPALVAVEAALGEAARWLRRLVTLAPPETLAEVGERLRLSRAEARALDAIARACALGLGPAAAAHLISADAARDAALIAAAQAGAPPPEDLGRQIAHGANAKFPLRARDLIAAGVSEGPELGAALNRLRRCWVERDFAPDRAALLAALSEGEAPERPVRRAP